MEKRSNGSSSPHPLILLLATLFVTALVVAQSGRHCTSPSHVSVQEAFIKTAQENTFTTSPVLPDCYTYAVEPGDPKTGPSSDTSQVWQLDARCRGTFIRQMHRFCL